MIIKIFWFHQLRPAQRSLSRPKADHKPTKNHPKNVLFLRFSISKKLVYYAPHQNSTLNKHYYPLMPSFGTSLQGCFSARIGAGAAHYKTLSNPLFRTVEPTHRSWDANGDSVHKVGIPSPPKKIPNIKNKWIRGIYRNTLMWVRYKHF